MKDIPEPSILMNKWSSKPADHNAIRVRNNQRRHRARVKAHIEDLEKRLAETNVNLQAALATIGSLTAEVESLRSRSIPLLSQSFDTGTDASGHAPTSPCDRGDDVPDNIALAPAPSAIESPSPPTEAPSLSRESDTAVASAPKDFDDSAQCGCGNLPPPAPGESTLPCSSAFQIIEQQNFRGVEITTIKAWLGPGFRGALGPEEACRVETNRLYELLDHLTSSW